ncbi:Ger(x)C family spore germination protein [Neobacillus niacini]|uniref:Ger(x)C family spore germination protein n=1 Tax=Neobacillus niacini TaxID=86668 RepID=UPI002FFFA87A
MGKSYRVKRIFLFIIIVNCMIWLAGCWSSRELSELMIVTGMGIDKDPESENYVVTLQIINPGEIASQTKTERLEVTAYQTKGKTLYEVMRRISTEVPRKMYLSHIQLIIFGEELAKEGIGKSLDFISRNHEFRTDFFILVSKGGKAEDILNVLTPTESSPSVSLYSSIEVAEKIWAPTKGVPLDELLRGIISEAKSPVLTGVKVIGDKEKGSEVLGLEQIKPAAVTKITGYAAFKKDKLIGWLNENESKGYNYIIDNVDTTVGVIPCQEDGVIALDVSKYKSEINASMKNGKPLITIDTNIEADIGEVRCNFDLLKEESIRKIEKDAEQQVASLMEVSVKKAKEELKSDIFGFGEAIHRQQPDTWKKIKNNWNETFQEVEVTYNIQYKIRRLGTITNPIELDKK